MRSLAVALVFFACVLPALRASATLEVDPAVLYAQMKDAYAKGDADGWTYDDQVVLSFDDLQRRPRLLAAASERSGVR